MALSASTLPSFQDAPEKTLRIRLLFVMLLRAGLITVLLGTTLALNYRTEETFTAPSARFLLVLAAITYVFTIFYSLWFKTGRATVLLARAQLALDLLLWGALTFATGGISSGFSALFDLWVIVWAVVLGGRAAFHCAFLSSLVLGAVGGLIQADILSPLADQLHSALSVRAFSYALGVNISALFLVALLVSSLVSRLERTDEGLRIEQTRRADLAQLHSDMIRSLTVGIATTDMNGRVLTMNPCGLETIDLTSAEAEGRNLSDWLPDLRKQLVPSNTMRSRGRGSAFRRDKERVPVEYIVAPLSGADKEIRGFIVVFSDLSEIRRLESALEKSRRLAALGELAANLAHEIRNPLGALSGAFQIFSANPDISEEDRSLLDIISREIHRLEGLVNDMLDYSRPKKAEHESVNVSLLIQELLRTFILDEDASERIVNSDVDDNLIHELDSAQIKQVLINLLQNAVQATEPGEEIGIVARSTEDDLLIEVRDSGRGIPAEYLKNIFEPFFSTRERGLGLGLALCRRIIEEHRGRITAENESGKGAVFRITLPPGGRRAGSLNGNG